MSDFTEDDIAAQAFNYELEQDMDDKIKRLIAACAAISDLLEASTDDRDRTLAYRKKLERMSEAEGREEDKRLRAIETPIERLRRQIVEMEAKDAKIREFREALEGLSTTSNVRGEFSRV